MGPISQPADFPKLPRFKDELVTEQPQIKMHTARILRYICSEDGKEAALANYFA